VRDNGRRAGPGGGGRVDLERGDRACADAADGADEEALELRDREIRVADTPARGRRPVSVPDVGIEVEQPALVRDPGQVLARAVAVMSNLLSGERCGAISGAAAEGG
jgi:hypothetical protein